MLYLFEGHASVDAAFSNLVSLFIESKSEDDGNAMLLARLVRLALSAGIPSASLVFIFRRLVRITRLFRKRGLAEAARRLLLGRPRQQSQSSLLPTVWGILKFSASASVHVYLLSEIVAYLVLQAMPLRGYILQPKSGIYKTPSKLLGPKERLRLFRSCVKTFPGDPKKFVTGWFFDADFEDILRDNAFEFLAWGFFGTKDASRLSDAERKEVERILVECEGVLGAPFPPGRNTNVAYMSFDKEPLNDMHHPLLYYGAISGLNMISWLLLRTRLGFQFKRERQSGIGYFHFTRRGNSPGSKPIHPSCFFTVLASGCYLTSMSSVQF